MAPSLNPPKHDYSSVLILCSDLTLAHTLDPVIYLHISDQRQALKKYTVVLKFTRVDHITLHGLPTITRKMEKVRNFSSLEFLM